MTDNTKSNAKTQLQSKLSDTHQRIRISLHEGDWVNLLVLRQLPMREIQRQVLSKFEDKIDEHADLLLIQADTNEPVKESMLAGQLENNTLLKLVPKTRAQQEATLQLKISDMVILKEIDSGEEFVIMQLPAIIGRHKINMTQSVPLAVDLGQFGKTVSGLHARITRDDTNYYIENLTADNRLVLERDKQTFRVSGAAEQIKHNDVIEIGRVRLLFLVERR